MRGAPWLSQTRRTTAATSVTPGLSAGSLPIRSCNMSLFIRSDDVLDGRQHVPLELRIIAVAFGILEHKRKLRDQILEIVNDEGRHAIEGVELPRLEQRFGRPQLAQKLAAWRLAVFSRSSTSQLTSIAARGVSNTTKPASSAPETSGRPARRTASCAANPATSSPE